MLRDLHQFEIPSQLFSAPQLSRLTKNDLHSLDDDQLSEVGEKTTSTWTTSIACTSPESSFKFSCLNFPLFSPSSHSIRWKLQTKFPSASCDSLWSHQSDESVCCITRKMPLGRRKRFCVDISNTQWLDWWLGWEEAEASQMMWMNNRRRRKKDVAYDEKSRMNKKQYFLLSSGAIYSPLQNEHKLQLWKFHWTSSSLTYHVVRAAAAAIDWKCNVYTWEFFWWKSKRRTAM